MLRVLLAGLLLSTAAVAQDGVLDRTFGSDGRVVTDLGGDERLKSIALEADGDLLAAGYSGGHQKGDLIVVRYRVDGSLDESFGEVGIVRFRPDSTAASAAHVVLALADGRILVGGETRFPFGSLLVRLNADGSLDESFGKGGVVQLEGLGSIYGLDVFDEGDIVVAGSGSGDFVVARLHPNGLPDSTFSDDGLVQTDLGYIDRPSTVIAMTDGKVFTAGNQIDFDIPAFAFTRHLSNGQPDLSFGQNGQIAFPFNGYFTYAQEALLLDDNRFLVFGTDFDDARLWRIKEDGALDPSFGSDGSVIVSDLNAADGTPSATLDADGRIFTLARPGMSIARFLPNGIQDATFGSSGSAQAFEGFFDYPAALALSSDGRALVVGGYGPGDSGTTDFKLARFLVEPPVTEEASSPTPATLRLDAFPNPLTSSVVLTAELPKATEVSLRIYDALGREVAALMSGRHGPGSHTVSWTPTGLAGGLYLARLVTDGDVRTQRLVLAR